MAIEDNKINIGDVWKDIVSMKINIGDVWKDITEADINVGDAWKSLWAPLGDWYGCGQEPYTADGNSTANYTYIFHEVVGASGYITKIEIYVSDESGGVLNFGVMDGPGGAGSYTDEHAVVSLAISNGLNQYESPTDFGATDLPIDADQYIGVSLTSGGIWRKLTGGSPGPGYLYDSGDQISASPSASTFSLSGNSGNEFQVRVWIE